MPTAKPIIPLNKRYTRNEEILSSVSHGVGALLGVGGAVLLIIRAVLLKADTLSVVSICIYGFSLILLYTMSSLYHAITNENAKKIFQILDHSTIFLLIAGTYTPYALITIRGTIGYVIFGIVWGSAVLGIVLNGISIVRFKKLSMILYLASGWATLLSIKPLIDNLQPNGLWLLLLGGLFYTVGIIFYALKKIKFFHGVWHFFVLFGSLSHFFSIYFYVVN